MSLNKMKVAVAAGLLSTVVAGVSMTVGANAATKKVNWATVSSAKAGGGMAALVKAAKKEGHVNVITIPLSGWANYGLIMKDFTKKYGIHINDAILPEGAKPTTTRNFVIANVAAPAGLIAEGPEA